MKSRICIPFVKVNVRYIFRNDFCDLTFLKPDWKFNDTNGSENKYFITNIVLNKRKTKCN